MSWLADRKREDNGGMTPPPHENKALDRFNARRPVFRGTEEQDGSRAGDDEQDEDDGGGGDGDEDEDEAIGKDSYYTFASHHDNCLEGILKNPPTPSYEGTTLQRGSLAIQCGLGVLFTRERPSCISEPGPRLKIPEPPISESKYFFYNSEIDDTRITGFRIPGGPYYEVLQNNLYGDDEITKEEIHSLVGDDAKLFKEDQWNRAQFNLFNLPGTRPDPTPASSVY